jgi:hypothetical protein
MSVFGLIGHCNKRVKTHFQADSEKKYMMTLPHKTSSPFNWPLRGCTMDAPWLRADISQGAGNVLK